MPTFMVQATKLPADQAFQLRPFQTVRQWQIEADSEQVVRDLWQMAKRENIPEVEGFMLESITQSPIEECLCRCHHPIKGVFTMLHFRACCEGQCPNCGRHFVRGLNDHKARCQK